MPRARKFALFLIVCAGLTFAGTKLPKAVEQPVPATDEQKELTRQGVQHHDRGQYIKAIESYQKVLAENPKEVHALYEMSYSYYLAKDFTNSLETARQGARYQSPLLSSFHMSMGNALDELGRTGEALEVYKEAVKISPKVGLLRFNLAVSLNRAKKPTEARREVQRALRLTPSHPSSHRLLGGFYRESGQRIPAILAYTRSLLTEPAGPRAVQSLPVLAGMLTSGVSKGKGENEINIQLNAVELGQRDGEGDFIAAELSLNVAVAAEFLIKPDDTNKQFKSQFDRLVGTYEALTESLQLVKSKSGFVVPFYVPYFVAVSKSGHTAALVAYAFQSGGVAGLAEWEQQNRAKLDAFLIWDRAYEWPAK